MNKIVFLPRRLALPAPYSSPAVPLPISRRIGLSWATFFDLESSKTYETTRLEMDYQGAKIRSWLDDSGLMVKQETPFGWTMETCTASEAFDAVSPRKGDAPDLLQIGGAMGCPSILIGHQGI